VQSKFTRLNNKGPAAGSCEYGNGLLNSMKGGEIPDEVGSYYM